MLQLPAHDMKYMKDLKDSMENFYKLYYGRMGGLIAGKYITPSFIKENHKMNYIPPFFTIHTTVIEGSRKSHAEKYKKLFFQVIFTQFWIHFFTYFYIRFFL